MSFPINLLLVITVLISLRLPAQEYRRWHINPDGSISWTLGQDIPHQDHIEMSGRQISAVLRYGVSADGSFTATRSLVWPMLRTIPNNTHASFTRRFSIDGFETITVNGRPLPEETTQEISLDGTLRVKSLAGKDIALTRQFFPSTTLPVYCEMYSLTNLSGKPIRVEIPAGSLKYTSDPTLGVSGSYSVTVEVKGNSYAVVPPHDAITFTMTYAAGLVNEDPPTIHVVEERNKRLKFIQDISNLLVLDTPDSILNTAFAFAKVRASESIFQTQGGPMHGPGGEAYYAAIWANDQAEYVGPFFPFLGYDYGNQASLNAYLHFARFMNDAYAPIPSSIIAEGTDIWNGAGDRGDAAMIAYGAGRYALASGSEAESKQLWPLIEWCLEYCRRHLNAEGVVLSDTDELEGRLPAGNANLCTSSLYDDALRSAVYLGRSIGQDKKILGRYAKQADQMDQAIEKYFGAEIGGYDTYRYYRENDTLRAWICIPLTMGILDRSEGTVDALFSPELWTPDGLASIAGDVIFWDRSTLYALRGVLAAGFTSRAMPYLHAYSVRRLLGDHVPYPVEAYPEGSQRHLSAESGLYCRVFTEGLFGIRPTGLHSFDLTPRLPEDWLEMALRHIHAFGHDFDIVVKRQNSSLLVTVSDLDHTWLQTTIKEGESISVTFRE